MAESLQVSAISYAESHSGLTAVRLNTAIDNIIGSGFGRRRPHLLRWFENAHQVDPGESLEEWVQTIPGLRKHPPIDRQSTFVEVQKGGLLYAAYGLNMENGPGLVRYFLDLRQRLPKADYAIKSLCDGESRTTRFQQIPSQRHLQATLQLLWSAGPLK